MTGNALFDVIVDTDETAAYLIDRLSKENRGRLTFMPLSQVRWARVRARVRVRVRVRVVSPHLHAAVTGPLVPLVTHAHPHAHPREAA